MVLSENEEALHIFYNKYDLNRGRPSCFDTDYDMAVSWQRLTEGTHIQEMDMVMLCHELLEHTLMNEQNLPYRQAHDLAEIKYNYTEYCKALDEKEGLR